jgi:hypothetical protein
MLFGAAMAAGEWIADRADRRIAQLIAMPVSVRREPFLDQAD